MNVFLDERTSRRLRNDLSRLGFCEIGVVEIVEDLARNGPRDLKQTVDAIVVAEGFTPDNVERRLWRQLRDAVLEAHHDSSLESRLDR